MHASDFKDRCGIVVSTIITTLYCVNASLDRQQLQPNIFEELFLVQASLRCSSKPHHVVDWIVSWHFHKSLPGSSKSGRLPTAPCGSIVNDRM